MKTILISIFLFIAVNIHASQPFVLLETENEILAKTSKIDSDNSTSYVKLINQTRCFQEGIS